MTSPSDDSLRFSCPQCMASFRVSPELAGKRRRCPRCQLVFEVPRKSRSTKPREEYLLNSEAGASPANQPAYIPVVCPVCHTRVYTTIELVGQKLVCPDCGTPTVVLPPAPPAKPVAAPAGAEGYPLCEEAPAPADRPATEEATIRLTCLRCGTMMYATEDQLGQRIVCPDCDLPAIVRRPVEGPPKKPPRPTSDASEYALTEKVDRKAGEREALDSAYVAALCPVCHTRLHATLDQVGGKLICPDCGTPTVIPPPPPPPRKLDSPAEVVAGYGLSGWGDLSPVQTEPHSRPPSSADDEPRIPAPTERHFEMPTRAERYLETSVRASLPRWPFLSGTFTFPVSRGARAFAFVLAAWAMLCVKLWAESIRLAALGSNEAWLGSILLGSAAFGLTLMWFALASATGLAVVRDTAAGCDEIQSWPDLAFLDWITEPFYVFNSICVGLLPGIGFAWYAGKSLQVDEATAVGIFILFPIALLSMLERNSPFGAVSLPVYQTFWMAWRGWTAFYLSTAALVAGAGALMTKVFLDAGLWGWIAAVATLVVVGLIYFRLLGRLAWYCTEQMTHTEPTPEADGAKGSPRDHSAAPGTRP